VVAEGVGGAAIAVEQRGRHLSRQTRREEHLVTFEAAQHEFLKQARLFAALGQLFVVLDQGGLLARCGAAVVPGCDGQDGARPMNFLGRQQVIDVQEHERPSSRCARAAVRPTFAAAPLRWRRRQKKRVPTVSFTVRGRPVTTKPG
jgi:hypothetical protein